MAQDSESINMDEAYEIAYAADKFGTAKWEVMKAIEVGGSNDRDDVQNYILASKERAWEQDKQDTRDNLSEVIRLVERNPDLNVASIANLLISKGYIVKKRV